MRINNICQLKAIILSMVIIMLLLSCKKDDDKEETPPATSVPCSINFLYGGGHDFGWVVLHDQSGTKLIDYKKYVGNQLLNFGEVTGEKIAVTIIKIDTTHYETGEYWEVEIVTEMGIPAGIWMIKGYQYESMNLGTANITIHYPEGEYNKMIRVVPHYTTMSAYVQPSGFTYSTNIIGSSTEDKFYMYYAVFSDNGGYCNWSFDNEIDLYQVNYFEMTLSEIITRKIINFNNSIDNIDFDGYWNDRQRSISLYFDWDVNIPYKAEVFLPESMPLSELRMHVNKHHEWYSWSYSNFYNSFDDIPEYLSIPEHSISGNYNESEDNITDINMMGNADYISGSWYSINERSRGYYTSWLVRASSESSSLSKPELPLEIKDVIGSYLEELDVYSLNLVDYNTATSLTDIVTMDYINNVLYPYRYDEYYSFSYRLGNSQKIKEENIYSR